MWSRSSVLILCLLQLAYRSNSNEVASINFHTESRKYEMEIHQANIVMQTNWEVAIATAPLIVAVIGDLAIIGANNDFPLEIDHQEMEQLHAVNYQPAIIQIGDYVHTAVSKASRQITMIATLVQQIEGHVRQVLLLLQNGTLSDIHNLMPIALTALSKIATKCVNYATDTAAAFDNALVLMKEVDLALASTKSKDVLKIKELKSEKENLVQRLKNKKLIIERMNKTHKQLAREMRDAQDAYRDAIDSIPTGLSAAFQNLVANIAPAIANAGATEIQNEAENQGSPDVAPTSDHFINTFQDNKTSEQFSYQASANMAETLSKFKDKCRSTKDEANKVGATKQKELAGNLAQYADIFANLTGVVETTLLPLKNTSAKTFVVGAFQNASNTLINTKLNLEGFTTNLGNVIQKSFPAIDKIYHSFLAFSSVGTAKNGELTQKSLYLNQQNQTQKSSDGFYKVGSNERNIAEMQQRFLMKAKDRFYQSEDQMDEELKKTGEMVANLAKINLTSLDVNHTIELIKKAMTHVTSLKKMWNQLTEFFHNLANLVNNDLGEYLSVFHDYSEKSAERLMNNETRAVVLENARQTLRENALKAVAMGDAIFIISSLYLNVSNKYVINQILEVTDYSNLRLEERNKKMKELKTQSDMAKDFVETVSTDQKQKFVANLEKQLEGIGKLIDKVGSCSDEEKNAMTKGIEIAERKADDYSDLATL